MAQIFIKILLFIFASTFALSASPAKTELIGNNKETKKEETKKNENVNASQNQQTFDQKKKGEETPNKDKILKVGNLAFPTSQQPTPLVSFGQNLIEENQLEIQFSGDEFKGKNLTYSEFSGALIYAFKDNFSIFIYAPVAIQFKDGKNHSSGLEDLILQLEYAPYTKENASSYDQLTLVANITLPTGSAKKTPMTGKGTYSYFLGFTFSRMSINWFYFTSYGTIFNDRSHRIQFGDQFFYQYGIGRRIFSNSSWLFDWMVEFDGIYSEKNKIQGVTDSNSGGNVLYLTPSLFLSSKKHLVMQIGIGFPIIRQLFGKQKKEKYLLDAKISWNF